MGTTTDDGQLIVRAIDGDAGAFTEIVRRHRDMVYGYCYHRTGSFEDARDLAQDTFVRAYTSLRQLRDHTKLAAWLRRIAADLCTRWHERRREVASELPDQPEPEHRSAASECVGEALANLPEKERLAVVLHYVNGYSYGDIAGFLEVTKAAVRGRLHRGRELFKAEVLKMTRDAFDENRLDEKFVVEAVRRAVDESRRAYMLCDKALSREKTDEAAALLDGIDPEEIKDPVAFADALLDVGFQEIVHNELDRYRDHYARAKMLMEKAGSADGIERWRAAVAFERLASRDLVAAQELYTQVGDYWRRRAPDVPDAINYAHTATGPGLKAVLEATAGGAELVHFAAWEGAFLREDEQVLQAGGKCMLGVWEEAYPERLRSYPPQSWPTLLPMVLIRDKPEQGDNLRFVNNGTQAEESVFETLSDTVATPAGTFQNCARSVSRVFESDRWEGEVVAQRQLWISPSVGVVKATHQAADGPRDTSELIAYHIEEQSDAYIPLAVGNWWKYRWVEGEGELGFRTELYMEIVARDGYRFPTIQYSFCVRT